MLADPDILETPSQARAANEGAHSREVHSALSVLRGLTEGLLEPLVAARNEPSLPYDPNPVPIIHNEVEGLPSAVWFRPRGHLGGDYYSVTRLRPGVGRFVIADVSGHDLSAAIVVAMMRVMRAGLYSAPRPPTSQEIITTLNNLLLGDLSRLGVFVTGTIVEISAHTGDIESYNVGHPQPRVLAADGSIRPLLQNPTVPIGVTPGLLVPPARDRLEPGDSLVLFTDGVIEAMSRDGTQLGVPGFEAALHAMHPEPAPIALADRIRSGLIAHEHRQTDDQCVLTIQRADL